MQIAKNDKTLNYTVFSDNQLAELLCKGDRNAFREIYLRYWKKMYQVAERKVPKEIAEEIVQDIFVNFWNKRETQVANLNYYLFSSVKYAILNYFKKQITENEYAAYKLYVSKDNENTTDYDLLISELETAVNNALASLPEKTQIVFRLSRFDFLPHKEIAIQLNISEKAIEYHITQALKVLKMSLKDFF
ncbi:MAG: RNA polymerase sigma-70 factor [Cytophagales bacterium]|nr:MAG: RNA polymerase sigma-70 factor [Cytophagales bacterium]